MEDFLVGKGSFNMPPAEGLDTIFEFLVNEQGEWEHWSERVSCLRRIKNLCFSLQSGDNSLQSATTVVLSVNTQRWGGALRYDTKNGCVAD